MERRNYPRIKAFIPIEIQVRHPESTEEPLIGGGVVANLSLTGIFFIPDDQPPIKPGDIRDFTFTLAQPIEGLPKPLFIQARGRVVRIELIEFHEGLGVAVDFLTGPYFG